MKKLFKTILCLCLCLCTFSTVLFTSGMINVSAQTTSSSTKEDNSNALTISKEDYLDRVKGAWVGAWIANFTGLPTEFLYTNTYAPSDSVNPSNDVDWAVSDVYITDDDTSLEYMFLHMMEVYGANDITYADMPAEWVYHIQDWIWVGNESARNLMREGYLPPYTGRFGYNSSPEAIDAQIECEVFGMLTPGMLSNCKDRTIWWMEVIGDGIVLDNSAFYAMLVADAFFSKDIHTSMDKVRSYFDDNSQTAKIYDRCKELHDADPNNWQTARQALKDNYFYNGDTLDCQINFAMTILALMYGDNDYKKTVSIGVCAGFDNDCNAATAATIIGVMQGYSNLPTDLKEASGLTYINTNRPGLKSTDADELANRCAIQAEEIILNAGGSVENGIYTLVDGEFKANPNNILVTRKTTSQHASWTYTNMDKFYNAKYADSHGYGTTKVGATAELKFTGSEITIYAPTSVNGGSFNIKIDDVDYGTAYLSSAETFTVGKFISVSYDQIIKKIRGLSSGEHTLTLTTLEEGKFHSIDYVETSIDNPTESEVEEYGALNLARTNMLTPICSVYAPTGVGAGGGDIGVICDGRFFGASTPSMSQYDTFLGKDSLGAFISKDFEDYIGYSFSKELSVNTLIFNEGGHWGEDGGWFANGTMRVEVLLGDVWTSVEYTISPAYPNANTNSAFGTWGDNYVISFEEVVASGVRLIGTGGGNAKIVSCGELEVYCVTSTEQLFTNVNLARMGLVNPICSVPTPQGTGAGGGSINVICDGTFYNSNMASGTQYDTYLGKDGGGNLISKDFEDYIGYTFKQTAKINRLIFNEGGHWGEDGGWFANGSMRVEILLNGTWTAIDYVISPAYPNGNANSVFGVWGETYTITFAEVVCDGIRLIGTPGGNYKIVSCGELEVYGGLA